MPVASLTVRTDFAAYFKAGRVLSYSFPTPLNVKADYVIVQDGDANDPNAQSAHLIDLRSTTARITLDVKQKGDGRCYFKMEGRASSVEEFHAVLQQCSDGLANVATRAGSQNWRNDTLPTLTTMSAAVKSGNGAVEATITAADLAAQGNETSTDAWIVTAVDNGTLKIGATALTATAYDAVTNAVIKTGVSNAYYTPPAGGAGDINAFKVKVRDAAGWQSTSAVQVLFTRT